MADIKYLNYGLDLQVVEADLMKRMADEVPNYLSSKRWARNEKNRNAWLNAYQHILRKGLVGASNTSGIWTIDYSGEDDINLDSRSPKEQEMYKDAAWFIQQQMASLAAIKKNEEEEKKKSLKLFDNKELLKGITSTIGNTLYGGRPRDEWFYDSWTELDQRNKESGIRDRLNRQSKMRDALIDYRNNFKQEDYNFEGSPFGNYDEFRSRLDKAINSLSDNQWNLDDIDNLNSLGINPNYWFNDGSQDIRGTTEDGRLITYAEYAEALRKLNELELALKKLKEAKEEADNKSVLKRVELSTNIFSTPEYFNNLLQERFKGKDILNGINSETQALLEKAYQQGSLNQQDSRLLGDYLRYIKTNNPKYLSSNLSDDEWKDLQSHINSGYLKDPTRTNYIRLPWNTSDGKYIYTDASNRLYFLKPGNKKTFAAPVLDPRKSLAYNNYLNNIGKNKSEIERLIKGIEDFGVSEWADVTSMLGDLVSLGGFLANVAGSLTSLGADVVSDISRDKSVWDIITNIGKNIFWGAAGLIPGVKFKKVGKWIPRLGTLLMDIGVMNDPQVQKTFNKLKESAINGKDFDMTNLDIEAFKYMLHAITGTTNVVKAQYRGNNLDKQSIKTIETKSGLKILLTEKEILSINKIGGLKGQKAAIDEANKIIREKTNNLNLSVKETSFNFGEARHKWNPIRYSKYARAVVDYKKQFKPQRELSEQTYNQLVEKDKNRGWYNWLKGYLKYDLKRLGLKPNTTLNNSKSVSIEETQKQISEPTLQSTTTKLNTKIRGKKSLNRHDYIETIKGKNITPKNIKPTINGNHSFDLENGYKVSHNITKEGSNYISKMVVTDKSGKVIREYKPLISKDIEKIRENNSKQISDIMYNFNKNKNGVKMKIRGAYIRDLKKYGYLLNGGQINYSKRNLKV